MIKSKSRHRIVEGLKCEFCGNTFSARKQRVDAGFGRFCSLKCSNKFHTKGNDKKYVGKENGKKSFDKTRNSYYVYWFEPDTLKRKTTSYAHWYWEMNVGPIPEGYSAGYKDGDSMNTVPENIVLHSPSEVGAAISGRLTGKPFSDEHKKHLSEARMGMVLSDDHKKNIGVASKALWDAGRFDTVHRGENHYWWKRGKREEYPIEFNNEIKDRVKDRDGHCCVVCKTKVYGKRAHVHHVDGDVNNNSLENLVLLCINCHATIHHSDFDLPLFLKMRDKSSLHHIHEEGDLDVV